MAEISRIFLWGKYEPDIGENRSLKKPFYLKLARNLTKDELEVARSVWTNLEGVAPEALPAKAAELIGPYVKMGDEPLVYQGRPINTLEEYLRMLAEAPSLEGWTEIAVALGFANSIKGGSATFSERLSGGFTTTRPQSP